MIANIIVKIFGAIFKIPLNYIILKQGLGIFGKAFSMYSGLFVIATAGLPVAVSKMVSASIANGRYEESKKVFNVALVLLSVIGFIGAVSMYFGAEQLATWASTPNAAGAIRMVSPAIFFVAIISAYRGYFQGQQNMYPTAISEIIEALTKLVAGLGLAYMFVRDGVERGAEGAILGVTAGAFCAMVYLVLVGRLKRPHAGGDNTSMTKFEIALRLIKFAVPITIGASIFTLTNMIDTFTISDRLLSIGLGNDLALELFGAYTGHAITMFNMPVTLVIAVTMSAIPAISSAYSRGDMSTVRRHANISLSITTIFAFPCAIGLSSLAKPVLDFVFNDTTATSMLTILAMAIIPVSIVSVSTAILQATGKVYIPLVNMAIGGIVKTTLNYTLVGIPEIGINGAAIGTLVCYTLIMTLNMSAVIILLKPKYDFIQNFIKPAFSGVLCGLSAIYTYNLSALVLTGNVLRITAAVAVAGVVYILLIALLGVLTKDMVRRFPFGSHIAKFLK